MRQYKFILSGGGQVDISILRLLANELKLRFPDAEFLL
jgi:hypothetical protein